MLKIVGNDVWRSDKKIGWIQENRLFAHDGQKLGYYTDNDIYDVSGRKVAYVQDDYLWMMDHEKFRLEDVCQHVQGGPYPNMMRAMIKLFLGD